MRPLAAVLLLALAPLSAQAQETTCPPNQKLPVTLRWKAPATGGPVAGYKVNGTDVGPGTKNDDGTLSAVVDFNPCVQVPTTMTAYGPGGESDISNVLIVGPQKPSAPELVDQALQQNLEVQKTLQKLKKTVAPKP